MADWSRLRSELRNVESSRTFTWGELEALVGSLPRSAYVHSAFWKGSRSAWAGFTTAEVRVGQSVRFVRRAPDETRLAPSRPAVAQTRQRDRESHADLILVGCVKTKLQRAAPAKDLYTSSLFLKERMYAENAGVPWFVLSAQHGLVAPIEVLEPYDLQLSKASSAYRREWGVRVVKQLEAAVGALPNKVIEIHAGSAYADAVRPGLISAGAVVAEPLRGLALGERLAWYSAQPGEAPATSPSAPNVEELARELADEGKAVSPAEFLNTNGSHTRGPGLYSWWVDPEGASNLTFGIGQPIAPGLVYAGLAGATRSRSGRKSSNTLWGRIRGMHLGGRHEFSTFRLSLGSILAAAWGEQGIDEQKLTDWMREHLRLVTVPVDDADSLDALETDVLTALDPPLNLNKMPKTAVRARLTELRRQHGRRSKAR
jgi:hypothetical protein